MKKNKRGFTLVELMVVIVIIGILAAIIIPNVSSAIKKAQIAEGVSNARNITTLILQEAIFDETNFMMSDDVIALAEENGYSLVSEVDGYAYWYDAENVKIVFDSVDNIVTGNNSSSLNSIVYAEDNRAKIEALSPSQPNLYYVDQKENELHTAINKINNLVNEGKAIAVTTEKSVVLDTMDSIIDDIMATINNSLYSDAAKQIITDYFSSYKTNKTLYFCDDGIYYRDYESNKNTKDSISIDVFRALVCKDTYEIIDDAGTTGININLNVNAPLIIPTYVSSIDSKVISMIKSGNIYISQNCSVDFDDLSKNVNLNSIHTLLGSVSYQPLSMGENGDYNIIYNSKEARDNHNATNKVACSDSFSSTQYFNANNILCEYLIPTISVNKSFIKNNYRSFSIRSANTLNGVYYSAVGITEDLKGYALKNIGYITMADCKVKEIIHPNALYSNQNGYNPNENGYELVLSFPELIERLDNYAGSVIRVSYQAGKANYVWDNPGGSMVKTWLKQIDGDYTSQTIDISNDSLLKNNYVINMDTTDYNDFIIEKIEIISAQNDVLFTRYYK